MKNRFYFLKSVLLLGVLSILLLSAASASASGIGNSTSSAETSAPRFAPSTPSNPSPCDGCTVGRTTDITLSWSSNGSSSNIHIWGGPGIDMRPGGGGTSLHLGSQWPGSYQWQVTEHGGGDTTGPTWSLKIRPYAPSNLNCSAGSSSAINCSWTKSSDDPGSVDSYNVYVNGSNNKNVGSGSTGTSIGGLSPNTSYSFYVTAIRQGVESDQSNTASATTNGACYSLTTNVNPSGSGTIGTNPSPNCSYDGNKYSSGTSVTLTGNPNASYVFANWTGDAFGSSSTTYVTMDSDKSVTANFSQACYSLITSANPGGAGTVNASPAANCPGDGSKYTSGTQVTLTATAGSGYIFSNWSGDASGSANPTAFTMTGDKNVTANFTQGCYAMTTSVSPGGSGTVGKSPSPNCPSDNTKYTSGTQVTLTANANSDYAFSDWSGDASGSATPTNVTMNGNKSVTANFRVKGTVILAVSPSSKTVSVGQDFDLVMQVQAGTQQVDGAAAYLNFDPGKLQVVSLTAGSSLPTVLTNTYDNTTGKVDFAAGNLNPPHPSGTFTLVTVKFNALAMTTGAGTSISFNSTPPRQSDATFNGASVLASTTPGTVIVQTSTCFTLTTSVNPPGSGTVSKSPSPNCPSDNTKYTSGTQVALTATANSSYTFSNWSGDASGSTNPTTVTVNTTKSVTANFKVKCFDLTKSINPANSGTVSVSPSPNCPWDDTKWTVGTQLALTAHPNSGYLFSNWSGDVGGSANPTSIVVNRDMNVTANFTQPCFTLTPSVTPGGGGTVSKIPSPNCPSDNTKYTSGTPVTLTANPSANFSFVNWSGDASGSSNPTSITMSADKSVIAIFKQKSLLTNPSFELDANNDGKPDGWGKSPKFIRVSTPKKEGSYSARLQAADNRAVTIKQKVKGLRANKTYKLSGWVNIPNTRDAFTFQVKISWYDSQKKLLRTDTIGTLFKSKTKNWVQVTQNIKSPAKTAYAQLQLVATSLGATIYLDKFEFAR